jgi:hypothetical protein
MDDDDIQDYKKPWLGPTDEDIEAAFSHAEFETFHNFHDDPSGWCKAFAYYLNTILKGYNS